MDIEATSFESCFFV